MTNRKSKEPIVVYWSLLSAMETHTRLNLMWNPPVSLISVLNDEENIKKTAYIRCSAMKNSFKNSFTVIHPTDSLVEYEIKNNITKVTGVKGYPAWMYPGGKNNNPVGNRLQYDFTWIFFCEEPLVMQQTPPYLHNTAERNSGTISAGSFDISGWFRAVNLDYLLWEGSNQLRVKKGDPAAYFHFQTDRRVILKQFEMSSELLSIGRQLVDHKQFFPFESLQTMYNRFKGSNRHKVVAKLIKENLLD